MVFRDHKSVPFFLFVAGICIALLGPKLLSHGMFLDGLTYASIARNMARGMGSLWNPYYTNTVFSSFHEHLPFGLFLQSLFFRVFGDHIFVEKLYTFLTFLVTGSLMMVIFSKLSDSRPDRRSIPILWLPLFYWILIPLVSWSYVNNMLENTMAVFTTFAVLFIFRNSDRFRWLALTCAGFCLYAGFFTKNFPALFPLALPLIRCLAGKGLTWKRDIIDTVFLCVITGSLMTATLLFWPGAKESTLAFLQNKVFSNVGFSFNIHRLDIVWRCFTEMCPALLMVCVFLLISHKIKGNEPVQRDKKEPAGLVFLLLGLSGVVPIVLSQKQAGYYMLAAFPMLALSLAFYTAPTIGRIVQKINTATRTFKAILTLSILFFVFSLIFSFLQLNGYNRDGKVIKDLKKIMAVIPGGSTVSLCPDLYEAWHLHAYFMRYASISLDAKSMKWDYGIAGKKCNTDWDRNFIDSKLNLEELVLYQRKSGKY